MGTEEEDKTVMIGTSESPAAMFSSTDVKPPKAKLVCLDDGMLENDQKGLTINLVEREHTVGRSPENTCPINFQKVSRFHAKIYPGEGKWGVEDLNSANGIWVNEVRVKQAWLNSGDYLKIGAIPFQYILDQPDLMEDFESSADGEESSHTIIGGPGMWEKISDAEDAEEEEVEVPQKAAIGATSMEEVKKATVGVSTKKSSSGKWVTIIILLVLIAGGGFFAQDYMSKADHKATVGSVASGMRHFKVNYVDTGHVSTNGAKVELAKIQSLLAKSGSAIKKYPEDKVLIGYYAQLILYKLERELTTATELSQFAKAKKLIAGSEQALSRLAPIGSSDLKQSHPMLHILKQLASFSRTMVELQLFHGTHGDPSDDQERPNEESMRDIVEVRNQFVDTKKSPQINNVLIQFPYLERMAKDVDEQDLAAIDRWVEFNP